MYSTSNSNNQYISIDTHILIILNMISDRQPIVQEKISEVDMQSRLFF